MPATFPAHPAAVLPLKLWRPAWFDGLALTVGSMAPDLAYALDGSRLERPFPGLAPLWQLGHSLPWFLAWALPITFALCLLVRLSAPTIATHLPAISPIPTAAVASPSTAVSTAATAPATAASATAASATAPATASSSAAAPAVPAVAFRDYISLRWFVTNLVAPLRGVASLSRGPRWYVTVSSAGIGALSHVVWDRIAVGPLDLASSLLGGLICFWLLHRLARRHSSAHPPAHPLSGTIPGSRLPAQPTSSSASVRAPGAPADGLGRRPIVFWGTFAAVLVSGGAFLPSLPGYFLPHTMSARLILLAIGAVVIASAVTSVVTAAVTRLGVSRSRGKPRQQ